MSKDYDPLSADDAKVRQFTVAADDDGARLDRWFKRHLPQIGFATVSRWARTGQIRVTASAPIRLTGSLPGKWCGCRRAAMPRPRPRGWPSP